MRELDCRGLACPAPVLQTKETLERDRPDIIKVIVDNEAAKQNVSRFLESQKFDVSVEEEGTGFHVIGTGSQQGAAPAETPAQEPETEKQKIMVMIATDRMGYGDDELGKKLSENGSSNSYSLKEGHRGTLRSRPHCIFATFFHSNHCLNEIVE